MIKKLTSKMSVKLFVILIFSGFLAFCTFGMCKYFLKDFYKLTDSLGITSFDEQAFIEKIQEKAINFNIYDENNNDVLEYLLDKGDIYTGIIIYDENEQYIAGGHAKILETVGSKFLPIEKLLFDFDMVVYNQAALPRITQEIQFKDAKATVAISSYHQFKVSEYYFYFSLFLSILLFLLPTVLYVQKKMRAINRLNRDIIIMANGDLENEVCIIKGNDEVSSLSKQLDQLRITLKDNIEKEEEARKVNQDLITTMSHDIRTPLTTLLGYLEIMSLQKGNKDRYEEYIKRSMNKVAEIKYLSDKILSYSLVHEKEEETKMTIIPYDIWFSIITENIEYITIKGYITEMNNKVENINIFGNEYLIKRVFNNVFSNISKYGEITKPISISIICKKEAIEITIRNFKKIAHEVMESTQIGLKSINKMMELQNGSSFTLNEDTIFSIILIFQIN